MLFRNPKSDIGLVKSFLQRTFRFIFSIHSYLMKMHGKILLRQLLRQI